MQGYRRLALLALVSAGLGAAVAATALPLLGLTTAAGSGPPIGPLLFAGGVLLLLLAAGLPLVLRIARPMAGRLDQREDRLRSLVSASPDIIVMMDEQGRFLEILTADRSLLYEAPEKALGRNVKEVLPSPAGDLLSEAVNWAVAESRVVEVSYELEVPAGVRWFEARIAPTSELVDGRRAVVCVTRDVTERREAESLLGRREEELARSEEKYRALFEESLDAIVISTFDGQVLDINPAGVRLFGFAGKEELLSADVGRHLLGSAEHRAELIERLQRDGLVRDFELEIETGGVGDKLRSVLFSATPFRDEGGAIVGVRGLLRDVTERRHLERQLLQAQKMEAVGRLAGGVAHDFNNLLTVIYGYAELARVAVAVGKRPGEEIEKILEAAGRAAELIRRLLAFSRQTVSRPRVLDLNEVVGGFRSLIERTIGEDIELVFELAPGVYPVQADPVQLEQVLMNLAVNARDAMPDGGRLLVRTGRRQLDPEYLREHPRSALEPGRFTLLAVSDTGTGMDAETRAHAFEPFFTTKEPGHGTGLGLSTVYGIVSQCGGDVWLYSEPGEGTTFKIYLPPAEGVDEETQPVEPLPEAVTGATVLLVEDEDRVRQLAARILEESGLTVVQAAMPSQALELVEGGEHVFDLLLTDLVLPEMSGFELADRVVAARPGTKVLYTSGYADSELRAEGRLGAGVPFVEKPFTVAGLLKAVRTALVGVAGSVTEA